MATQNEDPLVRAFLSQMANEPAEDRESEEELRTGTPSGQAERDGKPRQGQESSDRPELRHRVAANGEGAETGKAGGAGRQARRAKPAVGPGRARTAFFAAAALALAAMAAAIASAVIGSAS